MLMVAARLASIACTVDRSRRVLRTVAREIIVVEPSQS
jgi:hypothetical protein